MLLTNSCEAVKHCIVCVCVWNLFAVLGKSVGIRGCVLSDVLKSQEPSSLSLSPSPSSLPVSPLPPAEDLLAHPFLADPSIQASGNIEIYSSTVSLLGLLLLLCVCLRCGV